MTQTALATSAVAYTSAASAPRASVGLEPDVTGFHDEATGSVQYVVADPMTRRCAVIDPVLDFDPTSGATRTTSVDRLLRHIEASRLTLDWILDTHPHADHFSAAGYLRDVTGAPTAIGERVIEAPGIWKKLYNLPDTFLTDGSQWDHLFADGEQFTIGKMPVTVWLSPGHTLCSVTYLTGSAAFVHDTLFMPDSGTARADFPGGDARQLWRSIQRIPQLPDDTRLFTGHDYRPNGREARWQSAVAAQRAHNQQIKDFDETRFVKFRMERDRTLRLPDLMLAALQVNIAGGRLPAPEADDRKKTVNELNRLAAGQRTFRFENRLRHKNGTHSLFSWVAVRDEDLIYAAARDITEIKRSEDALRFSIREIGQADRHTTMSELTASIAHEINQPLSAIITNSQAGLRWLARAEPDLDEVRKALNRIADDGRRAGEVLSSIRAMFGDGRHEKQSVKVNDLICDVLTLIHAELERQHVGLQMELSDGVFEIIADRVQLQQVLLNLFNNALEAMSSVTGRPRVLSVKSQTLEPSDIAILVEDCGAGIDPKEHGPHLRRILHDQSP